MAKDKFEILDDEKISDIQEGAPLKEVAAAKAKKNFMVYSVEVEFADAIEASGEKLSGFAKRAMRKVAKEEKIV